MINPFFSNKGPFRISEIFAFLNINKDRNIKDININNISDLFSCNQNDITFFHSKKYKDLAKNTKASFCITTQNLKNELPESCNPLIVDNVLISIAKLTEKFYPDSINDHFDKSNYV